MNYADIKQYDVANGPGVRVSLFVSGCTHHCKNCFNKVAWDFNYGKPFTEETINTIINYCKHEYVEGLTILGGEPFEPENQQVLAPFLQRVKQKFPQKTIWCYTGGGLERDILSATGRCNTPFTEQMLSCIDVLVDGPFVESEKDITLQFRGSRNQRILNAPFK